MSPVQLLIPTTTVSALLACFEALGLNAEVMRRAANLSRAPLQDPYAAVPNAVFGRLWSLAFEQDPRPHLPALAGLAVPFGAFGLLDHLVASAGTVGEGLEALRHYFHLAAASIRLSFERTPIGDWTWIENESADPLDAISDEWTLAVLLERFRTRVDGFRVLDVHLTRSYTSTPDVYARILGTDVRLGRPRSGMRLAPGVWEAPLPAADPALHATLEALAARADVQAYESAPMRYAIQARLPDVLRTGQASAVHLAGELGLSLRTLQRRLEEEDTTFEAVLDDHRRREAMRLLKQGRLTMREIAGALGYQEASSLSRAFKRWTGRSPRAWLAEVNRAS